MMPTTAAATSRTHSSPHKRLYNIVCVGCAVSFVLLCVSVVLLPLAAVCRSTLASVRCWLSFWVLSLRCTFFVCFTLAFTGGSPVRLSGGSDVSKMVMSVSLWLFSWRRVVSRRPISTLTMLSSRCWYSLFSCVCAVCSVVALFELLQLARNGAVVSVSTRRYLLNRFPEFIHVTA